MTESRSVPPGGLRYRVLLPVAATALAGFVLLRGVLLARCWPQVDHATGALARTFATGLLYDLAFLAYAAVPLVL